MSEPFIAEIRLFPYTFAPRGWAYCNGQTLPLSQNTALFSLIGTTYGGDGRTTVGLPNLRDRAAMHPGLGPGLTPRALGQTGGADQVTLTEAQTPNHTHIMTVTKNDPTTNDPKDHYTSKHQDANRGKMYKKDATLDVMMSPAAIAPAGGESHENIQPCLGIPFCIALDGIYPTRS
ncbi:MAG: phage tail protein [Desulfobacterales bacterium]|nr:phage tail protein [Desulfobacterales bacterium]